MRKEIGQMDRNKDTLKIRTDIYVTEGKNRED